MIKIINGVNVYKTDEKCLIEMVKNNPIIFEKLPNACFGVVMAKGIDNNNACSLTTSTKPDRISHVP